MIADSRTDPIMVALAELGFDLKQLPVRAMLAYATRCARRAQPHFKLSPRHRDAAACRKAVDSAIRLAEAFVAGAEMDRQVIAQIEEIMIQALMAVSAEGAGEQTAAYAANAAYAVISATSAAMDIESVDDPTELANRVLDACVTATESAIAVDETVERAARLDWEMLHRMRLGKFPDLGEPINPCESGILGPLFCLKGRPHRSAAPGGTQGKTTGEPGAAGEGSPEHASPSESSKTPADGGSSPADVERAARKARAVASRIRARRERLRQDQQALRRERDSLAAARDLLDAERRSLDSERAANGGPEPEALAFHVQLSQLRDRLEQIDQERSRLGAELAELQSENSHLRSVEAEWVAAKQQQEVDEEQRSRQLAEIEQRKVELGELDASLAQRQGDVEAMARQLDKRSLELASVQERLDEERQQLAGARAEVETKSLECRDESERLQEQERQLAEQGERVAAGSAKIKRVLARLVARKVKLAGVKQELRDEHAVVHSEIERHQELLAGYQRDAAQLAAQQQDLLGQREAIETTRTQLAAEKSRLEADQASLEEIHAQLTAERERLKGLEQDLETGRKSLQADRAQLAEDRELLAMQQADLDGDRQKLEQEREELQRQSDACVAEQLSLLDEKAQVAQRESELTKTQQTDGQTLSSSDDSAERASATLADKSAGELKQLLEQLQAERGELRADRLHLAELISQLNEARPQRRDPSLDGSGTGALDFDSDIYSLTFLLETGKAKAGDLAEMFSLLSNLYGIIGGDGLQFTVRECRAWEYGEARTPSKHKAASERVFAEVVARADRTRTPEPDPTVWERFTSTLVTTVRFDTRLADYFNLGEVVDEQNRLVAPLYKAISDLSKTDVDDVVKQRAKWSLSIDAITLQRKRIESLRGKLERDSHMTLELAGAGGGVNLLRHRKAAPATKVAAEPEAKKGEAKGRRRGRKLLAIGSLIAVLAVILGICVL